MSPLIEHGSLLKGKLPHVQPSACVAVMVTLPSVDPFEALTASVGWEPSPVPPQVYAALELPGPEMV